VRDIVAAPMLPPGYTVSTHQTLDGVSCNSQGKSRGGFGKQ